MVKYRNYLIIGLFATSLIFPLLSSAQSLQFSPEFRASLLQFITLLQRLQALNYYQKTTTTVAPVTTPLPVIVAPHIVQISPAEGYAGSSFTILGSGFTPTGNTIHTTYDSFSNLSSPDGKTLTFSFSIPTGEEDGDALGVSSNNSEIQAIREEIKFYIENTYGKSNISSFIRRYK